MQIVITVIAELSLGLDLVICLDPILVNVTY